MFITATEREIFGHNKRSILYSSPFHQCVKSSLVVHMLSDLYPLIPCVFVCVCVCLSAEHLFSKYGHYDAELSLRGLWLEINERQPRAKKKGDSWACQRPQQEEQHPGAQQRGEGAE